MSIKDAIFNAEALTIKSWELAGLAISVYDSIYHGSFAPATYEGAMSALVAQAELLRDQTQQAINELYSAIHEAG